MLCRSRVALVGSCGCSDYAWLVVRLIAWEDGESGARDLLIDIIPDKQTERDEEFRVYISGVTGGALTGFYSEVHMLPPSGAVLAHRV